MAGRTERVLGIDPGETRIGLALTDPLGIVARPLEVLSSAGSRADVVQIEKVVREHAVGRVVIGLPLRMSGEEGSGAAAARRLAGRLRARLPGVVVDLWDERLTTVEAERTLIAADVDRRKRRRIVDGLAAALILQSYLDAHRRPEGSTP